MARGVPIVNLNYFKDLLTSVQTKQVLPLPKNYVPSLNEKSLNQTEVSCAVDESRSNLFQGQTFIFCEKDQMDKYETSIRYAKGESVLLTPENQSRLAKVAADGAHILIQPCKQKSAKDFEPVFEEVRNNNLSPIPETHIGVAILKNSRRLECNPERKVKLRSSMSIEPESLAIQASQTQTLGTSRPVRSDSDVSGTFRIPETLTGPSRTQTSKV